MATFRKILFMEMARGPVPESELAELGEAGALKDISRIPSRVRCATLGWRTLQALFRPAQAARA